MVIQGEEAFYHLEINNYDGDGVGKSREWNEFGDTIRLSNQWLTIDAIPNECTMILTAEPNSTGKSRTFYVFAFVDDWGAEVKVTQSR